MEKIRRREICKNEVEKELNFGIFNNFAVSIRGHLNNM